MNRYALLLNATVAGALLAGCGGDPGDPLTGAPAFVAIPRDPAETGAQTAALRQALTTSAAPDLSDRGAGDNFYLAINKKELGQRYFLSAFLRLYFPGEVRPGSTVSVGTKVVSFRANNNRVFVVRADDYQATSDTFTPDALILDAYPIVSDYTPFERLPGSRDYVLIDTSKGLSRFTVNLADAFGTRFQTDLSYVQRFRKIGDGITYENVLSGSAEAPLNGGDFRGVATLGIGLRRYAEGKGFQEYLPGDADPAYFFLNAQRLISNTGVIEPLAAHFNTNDADRPIEWVISHLLPAKYQGAVKDGIESWNEVFGRKVITARVATAAEDAEQDDKNYILYDADPTLGVAYANWRANPNTGETRGASVYINAQWFDLAEEFPDDPPMGRGTARRPVADEPLQKRSLPRLQWAGVTEAPLCELWAQDDRPLLEMDSGAGLTGAEKGQRYIRHVIAHEVGHDLGLRHNFKGSLGATMAAPGTSVMDYHSSEERVRLDRPGTYDTAAIKLLYGLSMDPPAQPFCTDDGVSRDPECQTFDSTADPLNLYWKPIYNGFVADYLSGASPTAPNNSLNNMLMFVRAGKDPAQRLAAWGLVNAATAIAAPVPMPTPAGYGASKDFLARRILQRLWLDAATLRGNITQDPPLDSGLLSSWLSELRGSLLNLDGFRTYATRRVAVDVLKKLQFIAAQNILRDARAALAAQLPMLSGETLLLQRDLISRIDAALAPYFN